MWCAGWPLTPDLTQSYLTLLSNWDYRCVLAHLAGTCEKSFKFVFVLFCVTMQSRPASQFLILLPQPPKWYKLPLWVAPPFFLREESNLRGTMFLRLFFFNSMCTIVCLYICMCATTLMPDSLRGQERSLVDPLELELESSSHPLQRLQTLLITEPSFQL